MEGKPVQPHIVRSAPGLACQSCRRLKMKCIRDPDDSGLSCMRCVKSGRECLEALPTPRQRRHADSPSRRVDHSVTPGSGGGGGDGGGGAAAASRSLATVNAAYASPYSQNGHGLVSESSSAPAAVAIGELRSYVSTSEAVNGSNGHGSANGLPAASLVSMEDTLQLIDMFRERLLTSIPVLLPADFRNASTLIDRYPALVSCICYVTARYVPGYEDFRKSLVPVITKIFSTAFVTKARNAEEELSIMQGFMILYAFTKTSATDQDEINFWSIKTTTEAFALHISLHRGVVELKQQADVGRPGKRTDTSTKKYLYWLWLFVMSHQVSLVTGTPPTIHADTNIKIAASVLSDFTSDAGTVLIVRDVELCLLWTRLGEEDSVLKEWWCNSEITSLVVDKHHRLSLGDIEKALDEWRMKYSHVPLTNGINNIQSQNLLPNLNHDFAQFCLSTHLLRRYKTTTLDVEQSRTLERCLGEATHVLEQSNNIGLARRDQLRYSPSMLFVRLSYCSHFILEAVHKFPGMASVASAGIAAIRRNTALMRDLGVGDTNPVLQFPSIFENLVG